MYFGIPAMTPLPASKQRSKSLVYMVGVRKGSEREFRRGRMEEVPLPPTCAPFALLECPNPLPLSFPTSATRARERLIKGSVELGLLLVTFFSTCFPFGISALLVKRLFFVCLLIVCILFFFIELLQQPDKRPMLQGRA